MTEMTDAQKNFLETLTKAYSRYNKLVENIVEAVDRDHLSVYDVKRDILSTISKSFCFEWLHDKGVVFPAKDDDNDRKDSNNS